jgi:diguanylate cyclase (GGDEF)-like protein
MPRRLFLAALLLAAIFVASITPSRGQAPLDLTPEERAWIAQHPVVDYAYNPRAAPFSFESSGRHVGHSADIMADLGKHTGIRFRALTGESWPQVLEKVRDGRVPLVAQLAVTPERREYLDFTVPLLDLQYGVFTGAKGPYIETVDDLHGLRVGVPRDFVIYDRLRTKYPWMRIVPFDSAVEGMTRLSLGEYDAVVTGVGTATWAAASAGVSNLRLRAILPEHMEFAIGVAKGEPLLFSIVQKGLAAIPPSELRDMRSHWLDVPGPGFTRAEVVGIAGGVAAAVFLFAAMNIAFLYLRLRERYSQLIVAEAKLERLATIDDLTGLGNRRAYLQAIEAELKRAERSAAPLAFIEMDLDHFKKLNDECGHDAGDRALAAVGRLIRHQLRKQDQAFRTGGEEFVLLLPDTAEEEAKNTAERLRVAIEELPGLPRRVTASFGCAVLAAGSTSTSDRLFAVADAALYRAKTGGRNRVRASLVDSDAGPARPANAA